jgi:hypothetical protein
LGLFKVLPVKIAESGSVAPYALSYANHFGAFEGEKSYFMGPF